VAKAICNMLPVDIRRARADEMAACAALYVRAGDAAFTWRPKGWFTAADFLRFSNAEEVYVACSHGAILGLLSFFRPSNFVHALYIDPLAQGFGIGTALLKAAEKFASGPLSLKTDEPNIRARRFYERHGFVTAGDTGVDQGVKWLRLKRP